MVKTFISILIAALLTGGAAAGTQPTRPISQPAVPAVTEPVTAAQTQPALITAEEAQSIALDHAGLSTGEVKGLHSKYDVDDGVKEYEVEFRSGDWEYDYTIHAESGAVLGHQKEYDPPRTAPAEPETVKPAEEQKPASGSGTVSASEAESIALDHAGLSAGEVKGLRSEYDVDDGVKEYEVEFRSGGWEYDYTIHAESGQILSWDKERDD